MEPLGSELRHRPQEEVAARQVAVWDLEAWEVDDKVVDSHDVDVDKAVHVVALGMCVVSAIFMSIM